MYEYTKNINCTCAVDLTAIDSATRRCQLAQYSSARARVARPAAWLDDVLRACA